MTEDLKGKPERIRETDIRVGSLPVFEVSSEFMDDFQGDELTGLVKLGELDDVVPGETKMTMTGRQFCGGVTLTEEAGEEKFWLFCSDREGVPGFPNVEGGIIYGKKGKYEGLKEVGYAFIEPPSDDEEAEWIFEVVVAPGGFKNEEENFEVGPGIYYGFVDLNQIKAEDFL